MCGLYKNLKWLGNNPSVELLTPNKYLVDFISISGIKQEEAVDSLHNKYEKYGLSLRELAAGSIHTRDTIAKRMRESGMEVQKPGRPKRVLKVGLKYSKDDLYKLVKMKRDSGLTYRKIAENLYAKNIMRKQGYRNWHPMMIKRILENPVSS